jgi:hypothetical protein
LTNGNSAEEPEAEMLPESFVAEELLLSADLDAQPVAVTPISITVTKIAKNFFKTISPYILFCNQYISFAIL